MANTLDHEGGKSIKWTEDRMKKAEKLGMEDKIVADAMDELLDDAIVLQRVQEKKSKEIREEREKLRDEEELYGLKE